MIPFVKINIFVFLTCIQNGVFGSFWLYFPGNVRARTFTDANLGQLTVVTLLENILNSPYIVHIHFSLQKNHASEMASTCHLYNTYFHLSLSLNSVQFKATLLYYTKWQAFPSQNSYLLFLSLFNISHTLRWPGMCRRCLSSPTTALRLSFQSCARGFSSPSHARYCVISLHCLALPSFPVWPLPGFCLQTRAWVDFHWDGERMEHERNSEE